MVVTSVHGCIYEETVTILGGPNSVFDQANKVALSIYPNPSNGQFRIDLQGSGFTPAAQVMVMDNTGRIVFRSAANSLQPLIALENMAGGIYLLRVSEVNLLGSSRIAVVK